MSGHIYSTLYFYINLCVIIFCCCQLGGKIHKVSTSHCLTSTQTLSPLSLSRTFFMPFSSHSLFFFTHTHSLSLSRFLSLSIHSVFVSLYLSLSFSVCLSVSLFLSLSLLLISILYLPFYIFVSLLYF